MHTDARRAARKSSGPSSFRIPSFASSRADLRLAVGVVVESEAAGVFAAAQALDAKQLLVRLPTDTERDEVVARRDQRPLGPASAEAATTAAPTTLSGRTEQLLQLLRTARERVQRIGRILLACGGSLTAACCRGSTDDSAFTGTRVPRAATGTATSATASEQRGDVAARHCLAKAVERRLGHRARLLERVEHEVHPPRRDDAVTQLRRRERRASRRAAAEVPRHAVQPRGRRTGERAHGVTARVR